MNTINIPSELGRSLKISDEMAQLIKQPYLVTMSRHRLNTAEMRIMIRVMAGLQTHMFTHQATAEEYKTPDELNKLIQDDVKLTFRTKDLLEHPESRNYLEVRNALKSLTEKNITLKIHDEHGLRKEKFTHLVKEGGYDYRDLEVDIEISKSLVPFLIALGKGFTRYSLDVAFNSSTPYTMKMYMLASHWRDKGVFDQNITEIREWFLIKDKYPKAYQIKKRILAPAIEELKEKGDIWPEIIGEKRMGRRFVGWKFKVHKRKGLEKSEKAKAIEVAAEKKREVPAKPAEEIKKAESLWAKCLTALKKEITVDQFEVWIAPIKLEGIDQNTLKLGVPNAFFAEKIEEVFLTKIMKNIDEFNVALIHLDRKKEVEDREVEKKKEEEAFLEKLQKTYGLSEKQAYKVEGAMESNSSNRKKVIAVLKEIDAAKRDGKIRSSIGGATASKLQIQLGIKLY